MYLNRGTTIIFTTDFSDPNNRIKGEIVNTYSDGIHQVIIIDEETKYTRFMDIYDKQIKEIIQW